MPAVHFCRSILSLQPMNKTCRNRRRWALGSTQRKSYDIRIIFLIVTFGLALINTWFATSFMGSGVGLGSGDRTNALSLPLSGAGNGSQTTNNANRHNDNEHSSSSYQMEKYNFTVGICAIVKDGEAYLTEWLDYHLEAMKMDAIYIYDNSPDFDLQSWYANTRSHPVYKRVEIRHLLDKTFKRQRRAYTDCVNRYGKNINEVGLRYSKKMGYEVTDREFGPSEGTDYLAMIDLDEFLVPKGEYTSVHGVIKDYLEPYEGGSITVNWVLFGSSNKTIYTPIPVTKRFQYRDKETHGVVKSIVKASDFYSMRNPHSISTVFGHTRTTSYQGAILHTNVSKTGASDPSLPSGVLLLYHYRYTSSKEYYTKKCIRGDTDGLKGCSYWTKKTITVEELKKKGMPTHIALRTGSVFDDSAWKIMVERIPRYTIYDDEMAWGDYT